MKELSYPILIVLSLLAFGCSIDDFLLDADYLERNRQNISDLLTDPDNSTQKSDSIIVKKTITLYPIEDACVRYCEHPSYLKLENTNYSKVIDFETSSWTWSGYTFFDRAVMKFSFTEIPNNAKLLRADLSLFSQSPQPDFAFKQMSFASTGDAGFKNNECYLERTTTPWYITTVNWNNQPTTTPINRVLLPESKSYDQDYKNVNILGLVKDILANPGSGIMMRLVNEERYVRMTFCSTDHLDNSRWPTLTIEYSIKVPADEVRPR